MADPQKKTTDPVQLRRETWFLMVDVPEEVNLAQLWCETNAPVKLEQRRVTNKLPLMRLDKDDAVCVIRRKQKGFKQLQAFETFYKTPEGERLPEKTPLEDMLHEIEVSEPVLCSKHWDDGAGGRFDGALQRSGFIAELGQRSAPYAIRFDDVCSRKNGELPDILTLKYV